MQVRALQGKSKWAKPNKGEGRGEANSLILDLPLRVASFLSGGTDGVKTDEGKEDDCSTTENTRATKLSKRASVGWDERLIVARLDERAGTKDEDNNDNKLDDDQHVVHANRRLDTSAEKDRQQNHNDERRQREPVAGQFEHILLVREWCTHQPWFRMPTERI